MSPQGIQLPDTIRQRAYVRRRAAPGSARQMLEILEMAPKVEPEGRDWIG